MYQEIQEILEMYQEIQGDQLFSYCFSEISSKIPDRTHIRLTIGDNTKRGQDSHKMQYEQTSTPNCRGCYARECSTRRSSTTNMKLANRVSSSMRPKVPTSIEFKLDGTFLQCDNLLVRVKYQCHLQLPNNTK